MPTRKLVFALTVALFAVALIPVATAEEPDESAKRWADAIAKFEQADREHPPTPGGNLFVGSSSIRMWDLEESFPDLPTINRGFGGSQVSDSLYYADRIVLPYKPQVIVLYAGDNDIAAGESTEQVVEDFKKFVHRVHKGLPETRIAFIAIKPSLARWKLYPQMREANETIAAICEEEEQLVFVDIAEPMLNDNGEPRKELFIEDGLHLSKKGYELWSELVRPHLVDSE